MLLLKVLLLDLLRLWSEELLLLILVFTIQSVHDSHLHTICVVLCPDERHSSTQLLLYPLLQEQQSLLHLVNLVVDILLLTEQVLLRCWRYYLLQPLQVLQLRLQRYLLELDLLLL